MIFRRKAIYEELHPETKAGAFKGNQHTGAVSENSAFTTATANAIVKRRRSVEIAAARGEASERAARLRLLRKALSRHFTHLGICLPHGSFHRGIACSCLSAQSRSLFGFTSSGDIRLIYHCCLLLLPPKTRGRCV